MINLLFLEYNKEIINDLIQVFPLFGYDAIQIIIKLIIYINYIADILI